MWDVALPCLITEAHGKFRKSIFCYHPKYGLFSVGKLPETDTHSGKFTAIWTENQPPCRGKKKTHTASQLSRPDAWSTLQSTSWAWMPPTLNSVHSKSPGFFRQRSAFFQGTLATHGNPKSSPEFPNDVGVAAGGLGAWKKRHNNAPCWGNSTGKIVAIFLKMVVSHRCS